MSDRHESPEIGAMVLRMLNALVRRAAEGDWEALESLAEIETVAPAALSAGLQEARAMHSLAELSGVLGVSRSAISQRTRAPKGLGSRQCEHATCTGMRRCRNKEGRA